MMNIKTKRDIAAHKTKILKHARGSKNIAKTCRQLKEAEGTRANITVLKDFLKRVK